MSSSDVPVINRDDALRLIWELSPLGLTVMQAVRAPHGTIINFDMLFCNASAAKALGRSIEEIEGYRYRQVFNTPVFVGAFGRMARAVDSGESYSYTSAYGAEFSGHEFDMYCWPTGEFVACLFTTSKHPSEELRRARELIESQRGALQQARYLEGLREMLDRPDRDSSIS